MIFPELSYKNIPVNITTSDYEVHKHEPLDSNALINLKNPYTFPQCWTDVIFLNNISLTNYIIKNKIFCMHLNQIWRTVRILQNIDNEKYSIDPSFREGLYLFCRNKNQVAEVKMRL